MKADTKDTTPAEDPKPPTVTVVAVPMELWGEVLKQLGKRPADKAGALLMRCIQLKGQEVKIEG